MRTNGKIKHTKRNENTNKEEEWRKNNGKKCILPIRGAFFIFIIFVCAICIFFSRSCFVFLLFIRVRVNLFYSFFLYHMAPFIPHTCPHLIPHRQSFYSHLTAATIKENQMPLYRFAFVSIHSSVFISHFISFKMCNMWLFLLLHF